MGSTACQSGKLTNSVCQSERAGGFNTAANVLNLRLSIAGELQLRVELFEVLSREHLERSDDALACERLDSFDGAGLRHLHLESALAEA